MSPRLGRLRNGFLNSLSEKKNVIMFCIIKRARDLNKFVFIYYNKPNIIRFINL